MLNSCHLWATNELCPVKTIDSRKAKSLFNFNMMEAYAHHKNKYMYCIHYGRSELFRLDVFGWLLFGVRWRVRFGAFVVCFVRHVALFFYTNNLKVEGAAVYGGSQMNWLCNNVTWWTVCVNNRVTQHTFRGLNKSRKTCTPALVYCQIIIPRSMLLINKNNKKPQGCYNNKAMRGTHHQKDKACGQEPTRGGQPVSYEDWQEDHSSV